MEENETTVEARMYPDIEMEELIEDWRIARQYREHYTIDFPSLDNLVDGIPVNPQQGAPYVGDTTLAGLVRSIPRDSLQQLPVFAAVVNGTKLSINALLASWILRKGVFNQDTFGKGLLSTLQIGAEQALTHGYAPFMTATGQMFDEFGTTMKVLHYSDVDPEPGIQDHNEAGFDYAVANLTKTRVRKILRAAEANPNTTWNVPALRKLLETPPSGKNYSIYMSAAQQKKAQENAPTYQFVTKYEVGRGGQFVTFCAQYEDDALRVLDNKSKFGFPRINFLVIDPAALSPFGTSRVRLASPSQNLMNAYYMNITSMLILNSKPPILKRGRFTKPVQLKQGAVWEAQDQNAKAELVTMDNGALEQFVPMAKQMIAQIQTMMGKAPLDRQYGNTSPGAKQQIKYDDTATNQITNILENFLRQYALVALDTYICEQSGEEDLIVDDECKNAINRLAEQKFVPQPDVENDPDGTLGIMTEFVPPIGDDNKMKIIWEEFYDFIKTLSVEIELSIGKDELDEKKRGDLQDMLTTMMQNAGDNPAAQQKISELTDMLLEKVVPESKRISPPSNAMPYQPPAPVGTTTETGEQTSITQ